jgi:heat-inducible transcriptional repressor
MLSERQSQILKVLIGEYVGSATPVGSETLARKYALGVSPATIRNELAELEERAYITHPHTSSGRVPSDKGYRYFVEYLLEEVELPPVERRMIVHQFHQVETDLEQWTRLAASVLARALHNAAVVTVPLARPARLSRLQLVEVNEHTALLVVVLQPSQVRQQILSFPEPVDQAGLSRLSARLTDLFRGLRRMEVAARAAGLVGVEALVATVVARVMETSERAALGRAEDVTLDGLRHMLAQPEFAFADRVQRVVEALEQRWPLAAFLGRALEGEGTQVLIGGENELEAIRECSLIIGHYGVAGELHGLLGVVGPTRLDYARALAAVRFLSSLMSDLVAEHYS